MDFRALECRVEPIKQTHYIIEQEGSNTVKAKKKKDYDYYICDNCKERIVLYKKQSERQGGILRVPINSYKSLNLALCNKCLKPVLKEINKYYKQNF